MAYLTGSSAPWLFLAFRGWRLILAMVLLSIFYIKLGWFPPGRLDVTTELDMTRSGFAEYTGALLLDSLLNRRLDIFLIGLRHLAMPVFTLGIYHWATLGRITRSTVLK